jgi:hypothetical protein
MEAASKTLKRTWQLHYKRASKRLCVNIPGKERRELPEPGANDSQGLLSAVKVKGLIPAIPFTPQDLSVVSL